MPEIERFSIHFPDSDLDDLRRRIQQARWPADRGLGWSAGTDAGFVRRLCDRWVDGFDWREQERRLNSFDHFVTRIGAADVHFVHARAVGGSGIPLILGHGWPSSFVEYLPLIPYLTHPSAHGLDGPAFDVVIPSLPGYGFSPRPTDRPWTYAATATLWHELMDRLGYPRFAAGGSDFGSGVVTSMALEHPSRIIGLHLSTLEIDPVVGGGRELSAEESAYAEHARAWWTEEGGYKEIQATKPSTLAAGLSDSPVGLASWIAEKWIAWGDPADSIDERFDLDTLLLTIALYWLTDTIGTSILDYRDNRLYPPQVGEGVGVRTRLAAFPDPAGDPPLEWVQRLYRDVEMERMPRGGHFAAAEEPRLLADDMVRFFSRC